MKNKKRLIGLLVFAIALMVISISEVQTKTPPAMQSAINCGTDSKPCFIRNLPTEKSPNEIREEKEKDSSDWWLTRFTAGLVAVGLAQVFLFWWQLSLIRSSLNDAKVAADAAKESADAMRDVATIMDRNGRKQMRAYLSFVTGQCFPQKQETGDKYELRTYIKNTGFTPAHAVHVRIKTKVFSFPLPDDADLSLPDIPISETAGYIAAGQQSYYTAWLDGLIDDETVEQIKTLKGKALYLYGTVNYKDVWGDACYTNFCNFALWDAGGTYNTQNVNRHNDAT